MAESGDESEPESSKEKIEIEENMNIEVKDGNQRILNGSISAIGLLTGMPNVMPKFQVKRIPVTYPLPDAPEEDFCRPLDEEWQVICKQMTTGWTETKSEFLQVATFRHHTNSKKYGKIILVDARSREIIHSWKSKDRRPGGMRLDVEPVLRTSLEDWRLLLQELKDSTQDEIDLLTQRSPPFFYRMFSQKSRRGEANKQIMEYTGRAIEMRKRRNLE